MTNKRKLIREHVASMIKECTVLGKNIKPMRTYPSEQLPETNVYWGSEILAEEETQEYNDDIYVADLKIEIRFAPGTEGLDEKVDEAVTDIKAMFKRDKTLSGTAILTVYQSTTEPETDTEAQFPVAVFTITHEVTYS